MLVSALTVIAAVFLGFNAIVNWNGWDAGLVKRSTPDYQQL
ncbi:MAG TPA: hypothetical protein VJU87_06470 [Gemmatimonadaceae bacterium]|nr:hypothetical protein [Gemmatimonadaceae bacterium]